VNPWGPFDPTMTVIRVQGESGPIGTIVHYGAHPTTFVSSTRIITRDWPGVMADRVEKLSGAPVLFINSGLGDVGPRMSCAPRTVGDEEAATLEVDLRAAGDAMDAYRAIRQFDDAELRMSRRIRGVDSQGVRCPAAGAQHR
jgi:hypothetical protein